MNDASCKLPIFLLLIIVFNGIETHFYGCVDPTYDPGVYLFLISMGVLFRTYLRCLPFICKELSKLFFTISMGESGP